jgi:hypothetical protein
MSTVTDIDIVTRGLYVTLTYVDIIKDGWFWNDILCLFVWFFYGV